MAAFQNVALILAFFVSWGGAERISSNINLHTGGTETLNVSQALKEWTFSIKHTLCGQLDFGSLQGIFKAYPTEVATMQKEGLRLANEYNCRLCDISGSHGAMSLNTAFGASLKCSVAAKEGNIAEACLAGNGHAGFLSGDHACIPCPEGCDSCSMSTSSWGHSPLKWFKCLHKTPDMFSRPEPVKGNWKCEEVERRGKAGTGFKQWCQYRKDFLSTSADGNLPVATSTWELKIPLSRCDMPDAPGASAEVTGIMAAIAPKLAKNYQWNCQFCRVEAGGPIPSSSFEFAIPGTGPKPKSWADAFCAFDQFGGAACLPERGPTDWSSEPCAPCPFECSSCEEEAKGAKQFSCKLRPNIGSASQLEKLLPGTEEDSSAPPATPKGFICDTPKKRTCQSIDPMCTGYKTKCQYQFWN